MTTGANELVFWIIRNTENTRNFRENPYDPKNNFPMTAPQSVGRTRSDRERVFVTPSHNRQKHSVFFPRTPLGLHPPARGVRGGLPEELCSEGAQFRDFLLKPHKSLCFSFWE